MRNTVNKNRMYFAVFAIMTLLCMVFIFSNSAQDRQASGGFSEKVAAFVQNLLDPKGKIPQDVFHAFVRKLAHFVEFAALGFSLCGMFLTAFLAGKPFCGGTMLFAALFAAVLDEFLQSFSDRYPSVRDVLLDFCGALFGMAMLYVLYCIVKRIGKKSL